MLTGVYIAATVLAFLLNIRYVQSSYHRQCNVCDSVCNLCQRDKYGGLGWYRFDAGVTCATIDYQLRMNNHRSRSYIHWINPSQIPGHEFQIYCDTQNDGGWNLIYSSRDDSTGRNNMQRGNRSTANILTPKSGDANKRLAYDVFKAIEASNGGYQEVRLTAFPDYAKPFYYNLIDMYFNKNPTSGLNFSEFIHRGMDGGAAGHDCSTSFYGKETTSGKPIALTWKDNAFVAGAVSSGCAYHKEVWNEISTYGGHALAPEDWDLAEPHYRQTPSAGSCGNRGFFHIYIR
ncbi:uncharacterized protein LOC134191442 [Corticium candelabrum]|uniref:uncharacterized protein LOC134191442 n=1 Tax=Corticium candelabrum TaxID=121492 RepID=UPI002E25FED2|nr:uncharacterized protein LOC134191442 [Corticium candelabrum]